MAKSKRKKLVEALNKTCALAIKLRDDYTCQYSGKKVEKQNCHWAHVIPGRGYFLRWNMLNSMVLSFHNHQDWHAGRITKDGWFKKKFPARWNYLHGYQNDQKGRFMPRCHIVWKYTDCELEEMLEKLQQKAKDLKGEL